MVLTSLCYLFACSPIKDENDRVNKFIDAVCNFTVGDLFFSFFFTRKIAFHPLAGACLCWERFINPLTDLLYIGLVNTGDGAWLFAGQIT